MAHRVHGEDLRSLWDVTEKINQNSLGRIIDSRDVVEGRRQAPLPAAIASRPDADAFRVSTPEKTVSVLKLRNKLSTRLPRLKREPTGTSDTSSRIASRVERFANPAVFDQLSVQDAYDLLTVEAEAATIVVPKPAAWNKLPADFLDDDRQTIRKNFQRDYKGRTHQEWEFDGRDGDKDNVFLLNREKSRAAHKRASEQYRARNLPFEIQLVSRLDMMPLNPRITGEGVVLDGLLRRTRLHPTEAIRRKYRWGDSPMLTPKHENEGTGGEWWLYEGWLYDDDECPYVVYSVGGHKTEVLKDGFEPNGIIDLYKTAGLERLPIAYSYGWRWGTSDADRRGIPYPWPFLRSWLAKDAFLTGKAFQGWSTGFPGWFNTIPANVDPAVLQMWLDKTKNQPLQVNPFEVTEVLGTVAPAVHSGTGHDVDEMVMALTGEVRAELVSPLATGGGNANSAIERSVVGADTIAAVSDIERGMLGLVKATAENVLMVCTKVARRTKHNVCVIGNAAPAEPMDQSSTKAVIELDPDWLGSEGDESYDLIAELPRSLADNLAQNQQFFEFLQNGGISWEMWCSLIGEEAPELLRAQVLYHQWLMNTPEGQRMAMLDAATYLGDQELADLFALKAAGQADEQGNLVGMLAGMGPMGAPGMPVTEGPALLGGQPAATGTAMPSPGMSQLAGAVSAGIQQGPQMNISGAGGVPVPIGV
jgi:hypothetical protein